MDTIINVQEVQAELERAARDAQSGPAEVRAGRFVHQKVTKATPTFSNSPDAPGSASKRRRAKAR